MRETIEAMLKCNKVPSIGGPWLDLKKQEVATPVDRAFLESWRNRAEDSIWSRTLAALQTDVPGMGYAWIVAKVLLANRMAEGMRSGDCFLEQRHKERQGFLELAGMAEALAKYFEGLDEETAAWHEMFLPSVRELAKRHQKEAEILRKRAGEEPQPTVPRNRQDRRKGRSGLRVRRAFIHLIANLLNSFIGDKTAIGSNHIEAIVAFTRIKFPEADADVVRKTLEPTTKEGRRRWRADASP